MSEAIFTPASEKQALMVQRASDTQIVVIGGAAGCVDENTEFLSKEGWKKIKDYSQEDEVMQVDPHTKIGSFVKPMKYIKAHSEGFNRIKTPRGINQLLSDEHKVLLYRKVKGSYKPLTMSMKELKEYHDSFERGAKLSFYSTYSYNEGNSLNLEEHLLRFYTALKADGHLVNERKGKWRVRLKKDRKIKRFYKLIDKICIEYNVKYESSTGFTIFDFYLEPFSCSKFFSDWMFCSREDAEILVDELKYWDGYLLIKGNRLPSITTVIKADADAIQYFFNICGYKATIRSDDRKGQEYQTGGNTYIRKNNTYTISPTEQLYLSLERKPHGKLSIDKVDAGEYKYCFEVPSGFFVIRRGGDIALTGNSGKSHILNHLPLLVVDDPKSHCIMYRRTNPQLEGGLWPNGKAVWTNLPKNAPDFIKPKFIREQKKEIVLRNGAKIKYQQAENTSKAKDDAQGQEFTMICVDEATQHEWQFLEYLMSRLRSPSRHFSRLVMSCNPDADHFLRTLISWYIGDDGFPIKERDGKVRYFVVENGNYLWGDSREELGRRLDIPEDRWESKILSFSFVSGTIYD